MAALQKKVEKKIREGREFVARWEYDEAEYEGYQTDQELKKIQPPLAKAPMTDCVMDLPKDFSCLSIDNDFLHIINSRESHRVYTGETMTLEELSYLLWCTQGVKEIRGKSYATLRTVPCGGARHEFECYFAVRNVDGLEPGLYHYLPMHHQIEYLGDVEDLDVWIKESLCGQAWAATANVVFYYSAVFYRAEWRYGISTHRVLLIDAGHITENMYLAATSIGLGGCAIGALDGKRVDEAFGLDGVEEAAFYAMPVGKVSIKDKASEKAFYAFVDEQGL
ncbi:MAG: SagB/ThcOx family dehydrogenase [Oscillospiraceae bacterium]|nr:SagB/ThcOx family dehydrogenase [Oscillospiraceae bacterium]